MQPCDVAVAAGQQRKMEQILLRNWRFCEAVNAKSAIADSLKSKRSDIVKNTMLFLIFIIILDTGLLGCDTAPEKKEKDAFKNLFEVYTEEDINNVCEQSFKIFEANFIIEDFERVMIKQKGHMSPEEVSAMKIESLYSAGDYLNINVPDYEEQLGFLFFNYCQLVAYNAIKKAPKEIGVERVNQICKDYKKLRGEKFFWATRKDEFVTKNTSFEDMYNHISEEDALDLIETSINEINIKYNNPPMLIVPTCSMESPVSTDDQSQLATYKEEKKLEDNCIEGKWHSNITGIGVSTWTFMAQENNKFTAIESGLGNAKGTAIISGTRLRLNISWATGSGYYDMELDCDSLSAIGTTEHTSGPNIGHTWDVTMRRISN